MAGPAWVFERCPKPASMCLMARRLIFNGLFGLSLLLANLGLAPAEAALSAGDVTLAWRAPAPEIQRQPDGTIGISIPGYARLAQPGQPQLPFTSTLIALPPGSQPTLEILETEETLQPVNAPLALAPQPSGVARSPEGEIIGGAWQPATQVRAAPSAVVEIFPLGIVRGVHLARIMFYPVLPTAAGLRVTTYVRLRVHLNAGPALTAQPTSGDPLIAAVRSAVANPDGVQVADAPRPSSILNPSGSISTTALIEVESPGLTAITYESLNAAGFALAGVDPAWLRLQRSGLEVAMEWNGDGDVVFEPGERLLFYASPRFNRYTATDVYRLVMAAGPVVRMTARPALSGVSGAGAAWVVTTVETNTLYTPHCFCGQLPAGRDGDRWTWDDLRQPGRPSASYSFNVFPVDTTRPATLTAWFIGYTDPAGVPDHHVNLTLNGAIVGTSEWDGQQAVTFTASIIPGLLVSGVNTLTLQLPGLPGVNVEGMWLDAFQVQYVRSQAGSGEALAFSGEATPQTYTVSLTTTAGLRAYDITDENQPVILTAPAVNGNAVTVSDPLNLGGRRYAVLASSAVRAPAGIRLARGLSPATGADYVIISHPDFTPALSPLIALRQAQGLNVAVEDVRAIYDAAGDGRPTPEAIRAYLSDVYATWSPRPAYVLLVGDGTFDPRRNRPASMATFLPPFLENVDVWMGETAADNRYVTVEGVDALPDIIIGRLPVNTLAEAQVLVDKLVRSETTPGVGPWNSRAVFIADNPDSAGDFAVQAEWVATTTITAPQVIERVYYNVTQPITEVRTTILNHWKSGASVIAYSGHSSFRQWGAERFFHMDDANTLNNLGRYPIVVELTCFTGSFHDAGLSTLDESLLRRAGGGAVGVWGPTGMGVSTGHDVLTQPFLYQIYTGGQPRVGEATLTGRLSLAATGQHLDLIDTFTWLGDPATSVHLTLVPGEWLYLPVTRR